MAELSDYYVKNGDQIYFTVLTGFNQANGQQFASTADLVNTNTSAGTLLEGVGYSGSPQMFFIVKLQAVDGQKTSFKFSQSTDPYIRLGDVVGLAQANPTTSLGQAYTSFIPVDGGAFYAVNIQNNSWIGGSDTDLFQVWIISDATNMGYYNSGCAGVGPNPLCNVDPTCGLQPPTNIPIVYGQSYVMQNYGAMVDQTTGGNNYVQWYFVNSNSIENVTYVNRISDANSKPSEQAGQGYFVYINPCFLTPTQTTCENYFAYFNLNVLPLPPDSDPVENKGTSWWVYVLILLGILSLIVIVIVIYIIERKK